MIKKFTLFTVFLFLTLSLSAQNWELFNGFDKYNYLNSKDSLIHTVWVDSTLLLPDNEMVFNKTIDYRKVFSDEVNDTILVGALKPNVLFNQKCIKVDDSLYYFGINKEWLLKPKNKVGETWSFFDGVIAEITDCYQKEIFDLVDSVKIIELSDGQIIEVSKSYGVIYWKRNDSFELDLIGIENKLGVTVPNINGYFDFNVGDIFQYNISNYIESNHAGGSYVIKYKIQSKKVDGDTISYVIGGMEKLTRINPFDHTVTTTYRSFTKTAKQINSDKIILNKYSREIIKHDNTPFSFYPILIFSSFPVADIYYTIDVKLTSTGNIKKRFIENGFDNTCFKLLEAISGSDTLTFASIDREAAGFQSLEFDFEPKIGLIRYSDMQGMSDQNLYFKGAIIDGDTIGEINNDEFFTSSNTHMVRTNILIFPNPFQDFINFDLKADSFIEIFDLSGHTRYRSFHKIKNEQLDLSFLEIGIYFVTIKNENSMYKTMIVKQ